MKLFVYSYLSNVLCFLYLLGIFIAISHQDLDIHILVIYKYYLNCKVIRFGIWCVSVLVSGPIL